eukprot:CAMPEP_0115141644 /NCGR_PEP_ID=MMETSP0227-20121206/59663_1 /TAXON_ID=89957 /ORGANISM="Polarella glacialis, Strain CCMP 1383" /LENGTH=42 /DNA_ID= /DNA_START= /DNA_END= /DNA_ORIENTATION=
MSFFLSLRSSFDSMAWMVAKMSETANAGNAACCSCKNDPNDQ